MLLHVSKDNVSSILYSYENTKKRLENNYDTSFFNKTTISYILQKCIMLEIFVAVKVQKLFMCMSLVLHKAQRNMNV